MKLLINGEERELPDVATVQDMVAALGLGDRRVAVEVNQRIVRRGTYGEHDLAAGDVVEIVHFVGGG
ncbi:MAG: thiamine biosynthesis protein ThiS [Deltaproteobacteria bacterium HGW-Deltaproteobacteria-14]|jgi:thiamine biosynthesis protein ThiS|nr:MAG: thiamine biosynthesis protein ThiS [Deltaproteobacteria bacterium HGW-Deltaproteobacteria-14]